MGALTPLQWFFLGVAVALIGLIVLGFLAKRLVAARMKPNAADFPNSEKEEMEHPEPNAFQRFLGAALRLLEWLLGTRGQAVYRATYYTHSWPDLCARIEESVRVHYASDPDIVIHLTPRPTWIFRIYRGSTAGICIQLIPQSAAPREAKGLLGISRWSKWHDWSTQIATGCFFLALFGCIFWFAVAGWQLPGIGYILLGISFGVAIVVTRLLRPLLAALEHSGRNRFEDEEVATLVGLVRAAVEKDEGVAIAVE